MLCESDPRWCHYVLQNRDELIDSWRQRIVSTQRVLFILGSGFDPRMCLGLETLVQDVGISNIDVWLIQYDEGENSPSKDHADRVEKNSSRLANLLAKGRRPIYKPVEMESLDRRRRIGPRNVASLFRNPSEYVNYTDIVLDISALPRSLYFPSISALLEQVDSAKNEHLINLHVFAWDDPLTDKQIHDQGISDQAGYLYPYGGGDRESEAHLPAVWIPLLGESQENQLRAIDELLPSTKEVVPVLPFPSFDARRADNIFLEYRTLLLEGLRAESSSFTYAAEQNPFAVYRQIMRTVDRYQESCAPLGGVRFVLSALSSKLFSLGALLAAYELRRANIGVGVAHVECLGYNVLTADDGGAAGGQLFGLWLTGEPYEE